MLDQLTLLVLVLAVAAGLVTAVFSALVVRARHTAFFRYFLANILLYNLLILAGLVLRHTDLQARQAGQAFPPLLLLVLVVVLTAIKFGWLYAFTAMTLVLPGQGLPERFDRSARAVLGGLLLVWAAPFAVGLVAGPPFLAGAVTFVLELAVIGAAGAACVLLLRRARDLPAGTRRMAVRIFGAMHLGVFVVMLVSVVLGVLMGAPQLSWQALFNGIFMIVYNLMSLVWILRFQPLGPVTDPGRLERFGISAREREIIELICSGRTNQEIADRLFISPATVKDHNYNIFRKTGVRNRVELVNLWRGQERSAGESS